MAMREDVRLLGDLPAFGQLEPEALRLIAFSAESRILRAGDVLFRRNDRSAGGYVVLSGAVTLDDGQNAPVVIGPPALIGQAALLVPTLCPATARAQVSSTVLRVPRDLYRRVLAEYPESALRVRSALAAQASDFDDELRRFRLQAAQLAT